jgi:integrase
MSASTAKRNPAMVGIERRRDGKGREKYRGTVYDPNSGRYAKGPWTYVKAEARSWRVDAMAKVQAGKLSAAKVPTIAEASDQFIEEAESGAFTQSGGRVYKPSTLRGYKSALRKEVVKAFGPTPVNRLTYLDIQRWVDAMKLDRQPGTVRNHFSTLRALMIFSKRKGWVTDDQSLGVALPTGEKERDRIATPDEAALLITALQMRDRAALGLAVYAGLRRSEVFALDLDRIDLAGGWIHVDRAWDSGKDARRFILPKNNKPRKVPIIGRARHLLEDHIGQMPTGSRLLFPAHKTPSEPTNPKVPTRRMVEVWKDADLVPLTMHEGRHTFASICIDAGLNIKTISTYMGHANTAITLDRYGHLMPGAEKEAVALLDGYLDA